MNKDKIDIKIQKMVKYHRTNVYKEKLLDICDIKMDEEEHIEKVKDTGRSFEHKLIADYVRLRDQSHKMPHNKNDTLRNKSRVGLLQKMRRNKKILE